MFIQFTLANGRVIVLDELLMSCTYAGVLEGTVSARANRMILESLTGHDARLWKTGPRLILQLDTHLRNISQELPSFTFAARFWSASPIRDREKNASHLVIIWLAQKLEPVFSENVLSEIKRLNWNEHAEDFLHLD